MNLHFSLPVKKPFGSQKFCQYIIKALQYELTHNVNNEAIQIRVDALLLANWITWTTKPKPLNAHTVCKWIGDSLDYKQRNGEYVIYLNPSKLFPHSLTPIERVARFLDKGNDTIKGTYFLSTILLKYQKSIYKYWRTFSLRSQLPRKTKRS